MTSKHTLHAPRIITEITPIRQYIPSFKPIHVCAYVRVSTNHNEQLMSLRSQAEYYQQKFSGQPNHVLVGVFSDAGISGSKDARPGFQAMLAKAKSGEIDLIYTKSISRFARNTLLLLQTVRELRAIGVGIVFEEQNINTLRAEGELMLTVLAGIAEEERKSVRSNVQWALRNKCLRGEVMVDTNRLIGYGKDELGKLIIIPVQAKIVRKIFTIYLEGLSAYRIAQILNQKHVPTYTDRPWNSQRVLSIISNEKYMGAGHMQKSFVSESGHQVRNTGQRDQYWVDDDHPAIISRARWEKAQLIRQGRVRKIYPFTRLLFCAYCGSVMIRVIHSRRWVSWICYRYLRQGKSICIGSRISEKRLIAIEQVQPITEPVIVEEIHHEKENKKRRQKDYRFKPISGSTKQGNKT